MRGCCDSEALGWKNAILGTPGCWHRGSLQSSGCGVLLGLEAGCRGRAGGDQLAEGLLGWTSGSTKQWLVRPVGDV